MKPPELIKKLTETNFRRICPRCNRFFAIMTGYCYWEWIEEGGERGKPLLIERADGVPAEVHVVPWYTPDVEFPPVGAGLLCETQYKEKMSAQLY